METNSQLNQKKSNAKLALHAAVEITENESSTSTLQLTQRATELRLAQIESVLGQYSGQSLCYHDNCQLAAGETLRLQLSQAKDFCDKTRQGEGDLDCSALQYLVALLSLSIEQIAFDTGIADTRLIDLMSGERRPLPAEVFELADYLYEVAEEDLLDHEQQCRANRLAV